MATVENIKITISASPSWVPDPAKLAKGRECLEGTFAAVKSDFDRQLQCIDDVGKLSREDWDKIAERLQRGDRS